MPIYFIDYPLFLEIPPGHAVRCNLTGTGVEVFDTTQGPGASDIAISKLAPAVDETIPAGSGAVVPTRYTIASGKKLIIGAGARFRIL